METEFHWYLDDLRFGQQARNRLGESVAPTLDGAKAALESFYYAFNQRDVKVFESVWAKHELIQLNNPLGGIRRGYAPIQELYRRIFEGPARVWVEFYDVMVFGDSENVVFAGRERGEFVLGETRLPLDIRTTRFFHYFEGQGWQQVHHHGSIEDAQGLQTYQDAVAGRPSDGTITTVAQAQVKPEERESFLQVTRTLIAETRLEPGVILFDLHESTETDNLFFFHEIFTSEEARLSHRDAPHTQAWFATAPAMLAGKPEIRNLKRLS